MSRRTEIEAAIAAHNDTDPEAPLPPSAARLLLTTFPRRDVCQRSLDDLARAGFDRMGVVRLLHALIEAGLLSKQRGRPAGSQPLPTAPAAGAAMSGRREKVFGPGRAVPLDRNAKARISAYARAWSRRHSQPGQHRGPITRAFLDVLHALLWGFHNSRTGVCFPSYEARIARSSDFGQISERIVK